MSNLKLLTVAHSVILDDENILNISFHDTGVIKVKPATKEFTMNFEDVEALQEALLSAILETEK